MRRPSPQRPPSCRRSATRRSGVQLQVARTPEARQALFERPTAQAQLSSGTSALYVPRPGGLAMSPAVLTALQKHAQAAGTKVTPQDIPRYVALGEHAVHALQQPSTALARRLGETLVHTVNPPVVLSPNMETARGSPGTSLPARRSRM